MAKSRQKADRSRVEAARAGYPFDRRGLRSWVRLNAGLQFGPAPVCRGHAAPWDVLWRVVLDRPALALVLGPRGGGKSLLAAIDAHLCSRFDPGHGTRILGGSLAQSEQVFAALRGLIDARPGEALQVERLGRDGARYANGSEVRILAASPTAVRGPHVPSLKLDEVDEIDPDVREAAMGMCMNRGSTRAATLMTSTWHRLGGPMSGLIERARAGDFPLFSYCAFEVLERCPEDRSGPNLENCPACPIVKWCHEDRDADPLGRPKAKRSAGHYGIDALIQKARAVSLRTFEADYLCRGPKADGLWFPAFDPVRHVSPRAEYDPTWPVHLAIDSGVFTGAVLFQLGRDAADEEIHVFGDYLSEGISAEASARAILDLARRLCGGRIDCASTDPAGGSRTAIGPTVIGEYERVGLGPLRRWPSGASVVDGLALVESFLHPADGTARLIVHPRCEHVTRSLMSYRRARRGGQWTDAPEDPQHPHEDLVDALRGGLRLLFPEGRAARRSTLARVAARRVF